MTVHLIKLSVGSENFESMKTYQARRIEAAREAGLPPWSSHHTRAMPRRRDEVLDGGSIYWVVKGVLLCRNPIRDLVRKVDADERPFCAIQYGPELIRVVPRAHRPFQGWRYLDPEDAPPDLGEAERQGEPPPEMAAELRALGLI
ncbi:MAG: DUF1489 domain-containing protein [Rhodospirillaceae bacterium]|jgi:hypothetical protein|nr:DUF1489 domain-containing protein [Rhodospirillaceae bacterium]